MLVKAQLNSESFPARSALRAYPVRISLAVRPSERRHEQFALPARGHIKASAEQVLLKARATTIEVRLAQPVAPADVFAPRLLLASPKLARGKNAAELGRWAAS